MNKLSISAIILTYNEEKHIERCIRSLEPFVKEVFVIDSFSNDETIKIAASLGARVYQHKWVNYATQFNWALENCPIDTEWIMRIDADEYVLPDLAQELREKMGMLSQEVSGIYIKRRVYFMNRWMRHGGYYPVWLLRIWRRGKGYCEKRWMDEHIKISEGASIYLSNDIVDFNLHDLTWWTNKHNHYATREAVDILNIKYHFLQYDEIEPKLLGNQVERKRWLKGRYAKLPLFFRPAIYFLYRYFFKLGFLDGIPGLIWNVLQGFWYRFLVDAKIYELQRKAKKEGKDLSTVLKESVQDPRTP